MTPLAGRRPGSAPATRWLSGAVLAALVLPLVVFFAGAWLVGWRLQHVRTGSMEPTYPVGSMVVSTPIDAADVETGMTVTFIDPEDRGRRVTHRVVQIRRDDDGEMWFVTKGDANVEPDAAEVPPQNVVSRARWAVPHLGRLLAQVRGPYGIALVLGVPLVMLVTGELRDRRRGGAVVAAGDRAGWECGCGCGEHRCPACTGPIGATDRYCRHCGARSATVDPDSDPHSDPELAAAGAGSHWRTC